MTSTEDLGQHLGVSTINGRVTKATYQHGEERVEQKLARWKIECLSLAGGQRLSNSVMPSYTMQTARLPQATCDELDRKSICFL